MDDGVKTFEARELATGRPVRVHLFVAPKAPLQAALLKALDQLPAAEAKRILDRGKNEGTPYVVTDRLVDHKSLQDWVLSSAKQASSKPTNPPPPPEPASPKADLGVAGAWKLPTTVPAAPASDLVATAEIPLVPGSPTPVGPAAAQPSEFTRMFQAPSAPASAPPGKQDQPGEFTRMFVAPVAPAPPASAPVVATPSYPVQKAAEPGEFTRMFVAPIASPPPVNSPIPVVPPAPAQKKPAAAGEFTRMFQAPPAAQPASSTKPAAPPAGEFTRMFQATPPSPQVSPANAAAPGEFTQFFKTPNPSGPLPSSPVVDKLMPQAPGSAGANRVGEFTRMFGKADLPMQETGTAAGSPVSPPISAPSAAPTFTAPASGTATQTFSVPAPPPVTAPSPVAPTSSTGPGDFTRQFSAPVALTLGQQAVPNVPPQQPLQFAGPQFTPPQVSAPQVSVPQVSAPQVSAPQMSAPQVSSPYVTPPSVSTPSVALPQPSLPQPSMPQRPASAPTGMAKSNNLPLILGIAAIVVLAVVVIFYFALRKH